jgi:hypothetical protein
MRHALPRANVRRVRLRDFERGCYGRNRERRQLRLNLFSIDLLGQPLGQMQTLSFVFDRCPTSPNQGYLRRVGLDWGYNLFYGRFNMSTSAIITVGITGLISFGIIALLSLMAGRPNMLGPVPFPQLTPKSWQRFFARLFGLRDPSNDPTLPLCMKLRARRSLREIVLYISLVTAALGIFTDHPQSAASWGGAFLFFGWWLGLSVWGMYRILRFAIGR